MRSAAYLVVLFSVAGLPELVHAEDWPRFRGPNGLAISSETGLPLTWSESEHLAWKTDMPGAGASSPIIFGDRVFVTCYSGYGIDPSEPGDMKDLTRRLVCLNLRDGKIVWQKSVSAKVAEDPFQGSLADHGYATHTPATDGERIYVFFGKSGVLAFDREGKQLWQTSVGTGSAAMGFGTGTSLLLYQNLVIVNANAESERLVALDKQTGHEVWKADAKGYRGCWSTPVLLARSSGKQNLVVHMPDEIWALNPADGGLLWYCSGLRGNAISSVVAANEIVYALGGGPGGSSSIAVRAGGRDDVSASHVLWKQSAGSYVPSPLVLDDLVYWVDDRGTAYCLKANTGEQVYRQRLTGAGGVYASIVAGDGKLYAVTRRKGTFVLATGPKFKVLAQNSFASDSTDFNASPAISNGSLVLRSNRSVYCVTAN
jgi:hypothetical protein